MSNSPSLFILSDNRDFIEPLSSLVTRELKLSCKAVTTETELNGEDIAVLVTTNQLVGDYHFPIIIIDFPIRINSLLAEIEKNLASRANSDTVEITPDWQLSLQHKTMLYKPSGASVALTDKESQLLQIIAQAGEEGISRESLLKEVWKIDSVLDTHTLETHIYRLRKKIKDAFDVEMIKAIDGGYRWYQGSLMS